MRMSSGVRVATVAVMVLSVLTGCGSDGDDDGSVVGRDGDPPPEEEFDFVSNTGVAEAEVRVVDNSFEERYLEVSVGTTITFTNEGRNDHNIKPVEDGDFEAVETEDFAPGTSVEITFDEPGVIAYYCSIHGTPTNGQNGAVKVVE